jgi:acyl-CoA synthetase (AMP-forming)/AMP-acid ligase II
LSGCQTVFQYLNYTEDDKILCPVPWSFDYGFGQLLTTLLMGVTQIVCPTNDPFTICDLIQVEKPDILAGTPSFYSTICQGFSPINNVDTSTIRLLTSTGSKFHQTTLEAVEHSFPTSETYRSASLPPKYVKTHPASVGFSIPGVELLVVRDDGTLADANETGEIVHRGTGVFKGYWGDPESTAKVLKPDPVHIRGSFDRTNVVYTGDLGRVDDDGFIFLEGRRDRLIKSMGVRVSPDEIEDILVQNTKIVEAAVFKKPHPVVGDLIVAVFTSKDKDVDQKKLKDYCRNSMSPFMMPREFHQLPSIPRTVNGKTDYKTLADTI